MFAANACAPLPPPPPPPAPTATTVRGLARLPLCADDGGELECPGASPGTAAAAGRPPLPAAMLPWLLRLLKLLVGVIDADPADAFGAGWLLPLLLLPLCGAADGEKRNSVELIVSSARKRMTSSGHAKSAMSLGRRLSRGRRAVSMLSFSTESSHMRRTACNAPSATTSCPCWARSSICSRLGSTSAQVSMGKDSEIFPTRIAAVLRMSVNASVSAWMISCLTICCTAGGNRGKCWNA
jgi:hypothetical protein